MKIIGYDTETYKGYVKVLANSEGEYIETSDTIKLLDFLFRTGYKSDYNVFYNLEYDLGSIIKEYVVNEGEQLHKKFYEKINAKKLIGADDEDNGYSFDIEDYHIRYLSQKMFSLTKGKHTVYYWDTSNFYKSGFGHLSLDYVSNLYLNDSKNHQELEIDRAKIGYEEGYYEKNRDRIIKYCIKDCELTKRLFERTIESYQNLGFTFPKKPYSEASIFKQYLNDKGWTKESDTAVLLQSLPDFSMFYNAYRGGIFRTFAIGHYENIYDIDINSAYPSFLMNMSSVVNFSFTGKGEPSYSFYKVRGKLNKFRPIKSNKRLIYGKSKKKYTFFVTKPDLREGDEIVRQVHIYTQNKPLLPEIREWYKKKSEIKQKHGKNSVEYLNIKIMINAGYGTFVQSVPNFTRFTNFVYGAYVTSLVRNRIEELYNMITNIGDKVISISTDGITVQNRTNDRGIEMLKEYIGNDIGQLTLNTYDSITQFANGIYILEKDDKYILKKRGFEQMKIEDLFRDEYELVYKSYKPMKIIQGIIQQDYKHINDFVEQEKVFSPYNSWIAINPELAEKIIDWKISDFHHRQLDVPELDLDRYDFLIKEGDNE
ncbi:MAG: hypothetical protein QXV17_07310 [Candidatus Micrarchaeaceae archaeon]